jgi:hypothetical protein
LRGEPGGAAEPCGTALRAARGGAAGARAQEGVGCGAAMATGKARSGARIVRLVPELPADTGSHVVIVRVEHRPRDGSALLSETLLFGAQPHQQGHPGPVKRLASPYRGVSFHFCTQRWRSRIKCGSKSEHLGYFMSDLEAAKAYNDAARKIHGDNAQLNDGVELCLGESTGVVSTVLDTTKMPYDGLTLLMGEPIKGKPCSPKGGVKKCVDQGAVIVPLQRGLVLIKKERAQDCFDCVRVEPQEEEDLSVVSEPEQAQRGPVPVPVPTQVQHAQPTKVARKPKAKLSKAEQLLPAFADVQVDMDVDSQLQGGHSSSDEDDVFLNYWFNQESLVAIDDLFLQSNQVGGCGGKRERDSLFSLGGMGMETKRIQC